MFFDRQNYEILSNNTERDEKKYFVMKNRGLIFRIFQLK